MPEKFSGFLCECQSYQLFMFDPGKEDLIAPDDWRRQTFRHWCAPRFELWTKRDWRQRVRRRDSRAVGPPESAPFLCYVFGTLSRRK